MTSPCYDFHVFICQNQRPEGHIRGCCFSKNADKLLGYMKARCKELNIPSSIRINKAGCLDQCEKGVAVVIYPEGTWYSIQSIEDAEEIIQVHIQQKNSVERLLMQNKSLQDL